MHAVEGGHKPEKVFCIGDCNHINDCKAECKKIGYPEGNCKKPAIRDYEICCCTFSSLPLHWLTDYYIIIVSKLPIIYYEIKSSIRDDDFQGLYIKICLDLSKAIYRSIYIYV